MARQTPIVTPDQRDAAAANLAQLDPSMLLLVLVHMTNDYGLLHKYREHFRSVIRNPTDTFTDADWIPKYAQPVYEADPVAAEEIRHRLLEQLCRRSEPLLKSPPPNFLRELISFCVADEIPYDDTGYYKEEMGFETHARTITPTVIPPEDFKVFVMGAGMIGINVAIKLQEAGFNYTIIEKRHEIGGTWSEHDYPGAAVDIPAMLYSFSFAQSGTWRTHYPARDEYFAYLEDVARKYGVIDKVEFETELESCYWDEDTQEWVITAACRGETKTYRANALVTAAGHASSAYVPEVSGAERFRGTIMHPRHWDPAVELDGKNVVLVGTGATACQVAPAIADRVASLTVVQRQPTWMLPNTMLGVPLPDVEQWARGTLPYYLQYTRARTWYLAGFAPPNPIVRIDPEWSATHDSVSAANDLMRRRCLAYLEQKLADRPDLLEKMRPPFPVMAKYSVGDCGYLDSLKKANVALERGVIERFEDDAVVMTSGKRIPCDVAIFATGYKHEFLSSLKIVGRGGRVLSEAWKDGDDPYAYMGMLAPGFPNFFATCGPNSIALGGGHGFISEEETHYIVEFLQTLLENRIRSLEPSQEATEHHNMLIDEYVEGTVFRHKGGANGWFGTTEGRVKMIGRWSGIESWKAHRAPNLADYIAVRDNEEVD